mmetsp:Transcript_20126/g.41727  ORF Transcript_20126/g.41727 Transcript_20126/m.41727 type:complete len:353 (+) Transcript_20126:200-1258(+)
MKLCLVTARAASCGVVSCIRPSRFTECYTALPILSIPSLRQKDLALFSSHKHFELRTEPVVLVDYKTPAPIEIDKVALLVGQAVVESEPVFSAVVLIVVQIVGDVVGIPRFWLALGLEELVLDLLVGVEDHRSVGADRVDQRVPVLGDEHPPGDALEHARVVEVVVHRLVVPVGFEAAALLVRHPGFHFLVEDFDVVQHGLPGPDGGPRADHRFVVVDTLAVADGPIDQPVGGPDRVVLGKELEADDPRGLRSEGVPLEEGVPHVGDENGPPAGCFWVFLSAAFPQQIPQQREAGPPVLELRVGLDAGHQFLRVGVLDLRWVLGGDVGVDGVAALHVGHPVHDDVFGIEVVP